MFLDAGYAVTESAVRRWFGPALRADAAPGGLDYKTRLQEWLQAQRRQRPEYQLVAVSGPDHQRQYQVEVLVTGTMLGRGEGPTKKRAEQEAARQALARLEDSSGAAHA